jgi:hypothetical protein
VQTPAPGCTAYEADIELVLFATTVVCEQVGLSPESARRIAAFLRDPLRLEIERALYRSEYRQT